MDTQKQLQTLKMIKKDFNRKLKYRKSAPSLLVTLTFMSPLTSIYQLIRFQSLAPSSSLSFLSTCCLCASCQRLPVLGTVTVFLLLSSDVLTQILQHFRVQKAPVGVFLHQGVDHPLSLVETTRAGVLDILLRFLSSHCV